MLKSKKNLIDTLKNRAREAQKSLPTAMREASDNPLEYTYLIYGRPGVGKTTWCASFPDCLLLSCERVSKGLENVYDFNWEHGGVTDWNVFKEAVALLEKKKKHSFQVAAIDTGDALYNHCTEWVCRENSVQHPEEMPYGKGWALIRKEFQTQLQRLSACVGIVITSHARESTIRMTSGGEFTRIQPTLPGQAMSVIKALTDFMLYAEFARSTSGKNIRVLFTSGDELIEAKSPVDCPEVILLPRKDGFTAIQKIFTGEHTKSLKILSSRTASVATKKLIATSK